MKRIGEFDFSDIGEDNQQTFAGISAVHTNFEECAFGVGNSPAEAVDDLLETITQQDYNVEGLEARILENCGLERFPTDSVNAEDDGESEMGYYVALYWNEDTTRADRLERLRKVPSVLPAKYESYQCVETDGKDVWQYVRTVDESKDGVPYSTISELEWGKVNVDDTSNGAWYVVLELTVYSDYSGSTVQAGNHKWFQETFGEETGVHSMYGGHGTTGTLIALEWLLSAEIGETILEHLEGLDRYPAFDDEAVSAVESENADKAWEHSFEGDFRQTLEKRFGVSVDLDDSNRKAFRIMFEECAQEANENWFNEGMGDDMYIRLDRIVPKVTAEHVLPFVPESERGDIVADPRD